MGADQCAFWETIVIRVRNNLQQAGINAKLDQEFHVALSKAIGESIDPDRVIMGLYLAFD